MCSIVCVVVLMMSDICVLDKSAASPDNQQGGGVGISMSEIISKKLKPSSGVKRPSMYRKGEGVTIHKSSVLSI